MTRIDFKNLRKYRTSGSSSHSGNMNLSIPVPKSAGGKTQRLCPNEECSPRRFLMNDHSSPTELSPEMQLKIRRQPGTPGCTCPYCGHDDDDQEFLSPEDIEFAKQKVTAAFMKDLTASFEGMAKDFNRKVGGKKSPFSISMNVKAPKVKEPRAYREDLLRNLACDICGRQYGVFAIALFCPDCGGRNLNVHFHRELELIAKQIDDAEQKNDEGDREYAYRLLGNAHEDVLTAFEAYQKTIFKHLMRKSKPENLEKRLKVRNDFQNANRSIERFEELNIKPYRVLSESERSRLDILAQKRHVIGHNLGVADQKYVDQDPSTEDGHTLHLRADEVEEFATLCQKIVSQLEEALLDGD